jgi:SAM-dependent methyltransferase
LVAEAAAAPIRGWDFSWFDGRASEERPSWHYLEMVEERIGTASKMLDLESGGGEWLDQLRRLPPTLIAVEPWWPNVSIAAQGLRPRGAHVVAADDRRLPFDGGFFDLVTSRHPVRVWWDEIARVLRAGGMYLSQQVGPHTVGELVEFLVGPGPTGESRDPELARERAEHAGLRVLNLRSEQVRTVFYDVGAVIYFLRLVVWIVPDFTVDRYRDRLHELHEHIEREGSFVAHATRFLIEAQKPSR